MLKLSESVMSSQIFISYSFPAVAADRLFTCARASTRVGKSQSELLPTVKDVPPDEASARMPVLGVAVLCCMQRVSSSSSKYVHCAAVTEVEVSDPFRSASPMVKDESLYERGISLVPERAKSLAK